MRSRQVEEAIRRQSFPATDSPAADMQVRVLVQTTATVCVTVGSVIPELSCGCRRRAMAMLHTVAGPARKKGGRRQETRASMYGMSASTKPREADGGTAAKASWKDS